MTGIPCVSPTGICWVSALDGEPYRPHWERWTAQEAHLFARDGTRAKAHVIVTTG